MTPYLALALVVSGGIGAFWVLAKISERVTKWLERDSEPANRPGPRDSF